MRFLLIIFLFVTYLNAQTIITGKLIDDKNEGIAYASIGSIKTNAAVLSADKGFFTLELKEYNETDSIKFFAIGFKERYIPIVQLQTSGLNELRLWLDERTLETVEVTAK